MSIHEHMGFLFLLLIGGWKYRKANQGIRCSTKCNEPGGAQPWILVGNRVSTPLLRKSLLSQVASPTLVAVGYRNLQVNATLVEKEVREYGETVSSLILKAIRIP